MRSLHVSMLAGLALALFAGRPLTAHAAPPGAPPSAPPAAAPAGHEHHGAGPAAQGGPGHGGEGHEDCDSESCPMKHGKGGGHGDADCPMKGGHGDEDDGARGLGQFEQMIDQLGLPEATHKKIKDLAYEAEKQSIAVRAELEQAKLEMHHLMEQDKTDNDAVLKQLDKVGQLKNDLAKIRMRAWLEARKLLSPEQRKKMRAQMMHGGGEHMMQGGQH